MGFQLRCIQPPYAGLKLPCLRMRRKQPVQDQVLKLIAGARKGHNSANSLIEYKAIELMTVIAKMKN